MPLSSGEFVYTKYITEMYQPTEIAVYIHWPFCNSKCPYCDFYKELNRKIDQNKIIDEYIDALARYHEMTADRTVKSIFFGGGTPSLITPQNIAKLLDFIAQKWHLKPQIEISLEANPNSHRPHLFEDFKNAGINRLSLGVQALNEQDLRFLGRTHSLNDARSCLREITSIFDNHSADLIYARPQQQIETWQKELEEITGYGLKHISLYQLTIEEGTVFQRKKIRPLDDENALKMFDFTSDFLTSAGYEHYEVSNFALSNYKCIHNLTYWQGGDYLGIGKSAHGRLFYNNKHLSTVYPFLHEEISPFERAEELIIMGLRLTQGICKTDFERICGLNFFDVIHKNHFQQLQEMNLIAENQDNIFVTRSGIPLLNEIIRQLCC